MGGFLSKLKIIHFIIFLIIICIFSLYIINLHINDSVFVNQFESVKNYLPKISKEELKKNNARSQKHLVVIFDTGIKKNYFRENLINEFCYSTESLNYKTMCQLNNPTNCLDMILLYTQCDHGTKVASFIMGANSINLKTDLISFQIFSLNLKDNNIVVQIQDFENALLKLKEIVSINNIDIINISYNSNELFEISCDKNYPKIYEILNFFKSNKIPIIISAGNNSEKNQVAFPSCFSNVIKVSSNDNGIGDTNLNDISDFSNIHPSSKYAIGRYLTSKEKETEGFELIFGTSFSAPIVTSLYLKCLDFYSKDICINKLDSQKIFTEIM